MAENGEDIEVVVAAGLAKLDCAQLTDIYKFLDLESLQEVKEIPGKTLKANLLKSILKYLNSDDVEKLEDQGLSIYLSLKDKIVEYLTDKKPDLTSKEIEKLKFEYESPEKNMKIIDEQQKLLDLKAKEIENLASVKKKDKFVSGEGSGNGIEVKVPSTVLRKDLKISGKIGDFGKKEGPISFTSLIHQVENAVKVGYEIMKLWRHALKLFNQVQSYVPT